MELLNVTNKMKLLDFFELPDGMRTRLVDNTPGNP